MIVAEHIWQRLSQIAGQERICDNLARRSVKSFAIPR